MFNLKKIIIALALIATTGALAVDAQTGRRGTDAQVRNLLNRLETKTDNFRTNLDRRMDNNRFEGTRTEDNVSQYLAAFENATDDLRNNFNDRDATTADVTTVLNYGWYLDDFMRRVRMAAAVENQWIGIRTDLNTLARYYNLSWNWNRVAPFPSDHWAKMPGNMPMPTVNEPAVRALLNGLETKTDRYRETMDRRLDNSNQNGTVTEDIISQYLAGFENATDDLRNNFNDRDATSADVTAVLNYGWYLDDYMRKNRLGAQAENQWTSIRTDLNTLANYYRLSWNWNQRAPYPVDWFTRNRANARLEGTYRLNTSLSDNVDTVIDRAIANDQTGDRPRLQTSLERRLTAPRDLAIGVQGNSVTIATNLAAPATIVADGVVRSETNRRGVTTRTTASLDRNSFMIATEGDRARDYSVTFTPIANNRVRVERRIYLENRNEAVVATSVYDQVSPVATWPTVDRRTSPSTGMGFYIPNGTRLTTVLRNEITSDVSKAGDTFTLEVTSPSQYNGAIITGHLEEIKDSGALTGRATVSMAFDSVQYQGRTYEFEGIVDAAYKPDGGRITVNNEGQVRDGNQTTRTVTRAGIGAILGAVIGAIAGGGEGAAIGAGVGAGAGAGSVLIQGDREIDLDQGTRFELTATGPLTTAGLR